MANGNKPKGRGWEYKKAQQEFLEGLKDDPNQPRNIRKWIEQELSSRRKGRRRRIRVPPGYHVGHRVPRVGGGRDAVENFHLEHARGNTSKGPRERAFAKRRWLRRLVDALRRIRKPTRPKG
jgi:hypothetical protein